MYTMESLLTYRCSVEAGLRAKMLHSLAITHLPICISSPPSAYTSCPSIFLHAHIIKTPPFRSRFFPRRRTCVEASPIACLNQQQDSAVIEAAWEILDKYNQNDVKGLTQPSLQSTGGLFALGASVTMAVEAAKANGCQPLLGICANNATEALSVLHQWTRALRCEFITPQLLDFQHDLNTSPGPVYIKFNPQAKVCYLQQYTGKYRGVILQVGQKQVGHLPLSLFNQKLPLQD